MSERFPEDSFKDGEIEETVSAEFALSPYLRDLLQQEAKQILQDCNEFGPDLIQKDGEITFVRIPVHSEIVHDAPNCGLRISLQIKNYPSNGDVDITYLRIQESFDTEDSQSHEAIEPSLKVQLGDDFLVVPLEVEDMELYKNIRVKELLDTELRNDLALEIYSDLRYVHELIRPPEVDPEIEALTHRAA